MASVMGYGQCIRDYQDPQNTIISNNIGLSQTISDGLFTSSYARVSNLVVGVDYIFTCDAVASANKFITVTDFGQIMSLILVRHP